MSASTAAVQVITWFDWAKIILPGVVTGLIAFGAAFIAYQFARKGRKEDILYKERYKSFEVIASYLYEIARVSDKYLDANWPTTQDKDEKLQNFGELYRDLKKLIEDEPNRRHLVLLNKITRNCYNVILLMLDSILSDVLISKMELENKEMTDDRIAKPRNIYDSLEMLRQEIYVCQDYAFKNLDLPQR